MAISTIGSAGLTSPLPAANLGTPSAINLSNATALPSAALPTGCVLQVVTSTTTSMSSTTSNGTFVTTGFSGSITPKFATSKIFAMLSSTGYATTVGSQCCLTLYRGGTNLCASGFVNIFINGGTNLQSVASVAFQYLDSPATTSSTTYTVYFQNSNNTGAVQFNAGGVSNNQIATLTLMEIAQ